ncbi:MAG: pyrroline-5-carboxylate reductase [Nitrospirae bacterium]|nr:MAG: pyrroline-5-carboxylate reductase [Nitrospirota bacterium]
MNSSLLKNSNIAVIGAGNMGEALVTGLLKREVVSPKQLWATDVNPERHRLFAERFQIKTGSNNRQAAEWADVLILAVKPQTMNEVLNELTLPFREDRLVISVAAGIPIQTVLARLPARTHVVRAMPNTPSSVLEGVTALAGGPGVSSHHLEMARVIFEAVGKVVIVEEPLLDAVTGLSGGGPAYVCVIIEALADGGVKMGLSRATAQLLAAQTLLGAAKMVLESGEHPGVLKDRVASPGGTTIAGLHRLERGNVRAALIDAVESATRRAQELGATGMRQLSDSPQS